jgi:hypothetical protein
MVVVVNLKENDRLEDVGGDGGDNIKINLQEIDWSWRGPIWSSEG